MSDEDHAARIILEIMLEPIRGLGVEMVRRLVEQKYIRPRQEQLRERHTAFLAARKVLDVRMRRRAVQRLQRLLHLRVEIPQILAVDDVLQLRHFVGGLVGIVHRQLVIAVEHGLLLRHAVHGVAEHVLRLVELRLLREIAHAHAIGGPGLALVLLLHARHDLQERGLARAVHAHHADFRVGQKGERDVAEHLLSAGVGFGKLLHHKDILRGRHGVSFFEGGCAFRRDERMAASVMAAPVRCEDAEIRQLM